MFEIQAIYQMSVSNDQIVALNMKMLYCTFKVECN